MYNCAPLVIFVYKRPEVTRQMFAAANKNLLSEQTDVFVYCDEYKEEADRVKVNEVKRIVHDFARHSNFKSITIRAAAQHEGLANSIIKGVTEVINEYGKVIVLEDDLLVSHNFLKFMNDCLDFYQYDASVWSIGGTLKKLRGLKNYDKDVYACYRAGSWGWASWLDRWKKVDWKVSDYNNFIKDRRQKRRFNRGGSDLVGMLRAQQEGKIDSWAVRWGYQESKEDMVSIFPRKSLVKNIGFGADATHTPIGKDIYKTECYEDYEYRLERVEIDKRLMREYQWYMSRIYRTLLAYRIKFYRIISN